MQDNINVMDLNLKQLRQMCGLTLRDIAELLKITHQSYQYKEVGARKFKDGEINILANVFSLDLKIIRKIIDNKDINKFVILLDKVK